MKKSSGLMSKILPMLIGVVVGYIAKDSIKPMIDGLMSKFKKN